MTSPKVDSLSTSDMCKHVKHLGYGSAAQVRLYGEEFEVVSDPFPRAGGIAVQARARKDSTVRVLRLPTTILQPVRGRVTNAA